MAVWSKLHRLLENKTMTPHIEKEITDKVIELVLGLCPDAGFTSKYGGTLIEAVAGDAKSVIGGLFFYAKHASFEFTNGATFEAQTIISRGKANFAVISNCTPHKT